MVNRRQFIQAGITITALPAAMGHEHGAAAQTLAGPAFHRVVFDERSAEAAAFGREAARLGESACAIRGDVTDFWYEHLHRQWQEKPLPIAGLTGHGPLFCLERWAWDAGMEVVFRADHRRAPGGLEHTFAGPPPVLADAVASISGSAWPAQMARLAVSCRQDICGLAQTSIATPGQAVGVGDDDALVSWVIAPRRRA